MALDGTTPLAAVRGAALHVWHGVVLTGIAITEAFAILWAAVCVTLLVVGLGLVLVPSAFVLLRSDAKRQRRLALRYADVKVLESYRPLPEGRGFRRSWHRLFAMVGDDATWRDVLWHIVNPFVGIALAFLPAFGILHSLWGFVLPFLWEPVISSWGGAWYAFVPLLGPGTVAIAVVVAVVELAISLLIAGPLIRVYGRWVRAVLGRPSAIVLNTRIEELSDSRADAVDLQAAEIRRIERDLHDGAQARLVAMGMNLTAASRLIDADPSAARALLDEAKSSSSLALQELRDLVKGIHPPVLSDRGLVDAVRALAVDSPVATEVSTGPGLAGRPLPPVESAVYFAISELLANAAKHADAHRMAVAIDHDGSILTASVLDDGTGGAELRPGSGLDGIRRRLASFDGTLSISSPAGGPSSVSLRVPCKLLDRADISID